MKRIIIALLALAGANIASSQTAFSALTALATPADGDLLAITDISDTGGSVNGTTKKITLTTLETWFHSQAVVISGVWEVQDDTEFNFGNDADWNQFYDSTAEQLEFSTTAFNGSADGTGMFRIRVNDAAGTIDADQTIFEIVDNATDLFSVDAEGDVTAAGDITVTNANADRLDYNEQASISNPSATKGSIYLDSDDNTFKAIVADEGNTLQTVVTDVSTTTLTNKTVTGATIDKTSTHAIFTEAHAVAHALTASECYGAQYFVTGAVDIDLPNVEEGMSLTIFVDAAVIVSIQPNTGDTIRLDGTNLTASNELDSTATLGAMVVFTAHPTANTWYAASDGNWADGGAAD